jgi:hypothetical protein
MLERDPFRRYPNYGSLLADIKEAQQSSIPKKNNHAHNGHHKKKKKTYAAHLISVLITLVIAGSIAAVFALRSKSGKPARTASAQHQARTVTRQKTASKSDNAKSKPSPAKTTTAAKQPRQTGPIELTTLQDDGADAYIQGPGGRQSEHHSNFGSEEFIWIKAGRKDSLHLSRKAYIKFDLSAAQGPWTKARLELMADKSGSNRNSDRYSLTLWGLATSAPDWREGIDLNSEILPINWDNAPGNDREDPSSMDSQHAVALITLPIEANPEVGSVIAFDSQQPDGQKLLDYLNRNSEQPITFMITADNQVSQRAGWKFASREHPFLAPPTLKLEP